MIRRNQAHHAATALLGDETYHQGLVDLRSGSQSSEPATENASPFVTQPIMPDGVKSHPAVTLSTLFVSRLKDLYQGTATNGFKGTAFYTEDGGTLSALSSFSAPSEGTTSSYAFGECQFDVNANSSAQTFLAKAGFSVAQIDELRSQYGTVLPITGTLSLSSMDTQLSGYLATSRGQTAMAGLLNGRWTSVLLPETAILLNSSDSAGPGIAAAVYSGPEAIQRIVDFTNQFGNIANRRSFLSGQTVTFGITTNGGTSIPITWESRLSADQNIRKFIINQFESNNAPSSWQSQINREDTKFDHAVGQEALGRTGITAQTSATLDNLQNVNVEVLSGTFTSGGSQQSDYLILAPGAVGKTTATASSLPDEYSCGGNSISLQGTNISVACGTGFVLSVGGPNITGTVLPNSTATLTSAGGSFYLEFGANVTLNAGTSGTFSCGSTTGDIQHVVADPGNVSISCSASGQLTTTINNGTIDTTRGQSNIIDGNGNIDVWGASVGGTVSGNSNTIDVGMGQTGNPSTMGTDNFTGSNLTINDYVPSLIFYFGTGGTFTGNAVQQIGSSSLPPSLPGPS